MSEALAAPPPARNTAKKVALATAAAAMLVVAWRLGAFQVFGDPAHAREALLALGSVGFLAFVLAFAFLQPFGVPGVMFIVGASLVWPPPIAVALSLVGSTLASINGFAFARYVARDWVERRIPPRLRAYDDRLAARGFATVLVLRLVFWMNPWLHALFGLSRVRFSTHLIASVIAYVGPVVAVTYLGDSAFDVLKKLPREQSIAIGCVVAAVVAALVVIRVRRRRRQLGREGSVARLRDEE
jgi:uncharacterized membrane protein YdjX (TVP38/TMEM64 family)